MGLLLRRLMLAVGVVTTVALGTGQAAFAADHAVAAVAVLAYAFDDDDDDDQDEHESRARPRSRPRVARASPASPGKSVQRRTGRSACASCPRRAVPPKGALTRAESTPPKTGPRQDATTSREPRAAREARVVQGGVPKTEGFVPGEGGVPKAGSAPAEGGVPKVGSVPGDGGVPREEGKPGEGATIPAKTMVRDDVAPARADSRLPGTGGGDQVWLLVVLALVSVVAVLGGSFWFAHRLAAGA
jgi:hypothetical protein